VPDMMIVIDIYYYVDEYVENYD